MTKTEKKRDSQIVKQLTLVCNEFKHSLSGFEFISHTANFKQLNQSLSIDIYFSDKATLEALDESQRHKALTLIESLLKEIEITLTHPAKHIHWRVK